MSSIYDRIPSSMRIALAAIWPAALLLYGLWSFPLAIFGPDRELIPGDLGDARFIHAPSSNGKVRIDRLSDRYYAQRFEAARTFFD